MALHCLVVELLSLFSFVSQIKNPCISHLLFHLYQISLILFGIFTGQDLDFFFSLIMYQITVDTWSQGH